jgi:2-(1,2-epoxy-1,2-dihydrophenyl)acetyl-CoA isomerase
MPYETILYTVADNIATLTLNRPEKYNAFTAVMLREVQGAMKQCERDDTVRAVIITGAGKGFCTGQDLAEIAERGDISVGEHIRTGYAPIIRAMRALEKPTIGAINGVAAGAGSSVAMACDLRLMAEEASFVFAAFANIGLVPDAGATWLLPGLLGTSRALEFMLLADSKNRVSAQRAFELGLCMSVVSTTQLMSDAQALAQRLASLPPIAIGLTKRAVYRSVQNTLDEQLELEAQLQEYAGRTSDFNEGVAAFLERRKPKFTGR